MKHAIFDQEAVASAISGIQAARDAALDKAIKDGIDLLTIARVMGDVPADLQIEAQIDEIVSAFSIADDGERAALRASIAGRFEAIVGATANVR